MVIIVVYYDLGPYHWGEKATQPTLNHIYICILVYHNVSLYDVRIILFYHVIFDCIVYYVLLNGM